MRCLVASCLRHNYSNSFLGFTTLRSKVILPYVRTVCKFETCYIPDSKSISKRGFDLNLANSAPFHGQWRRHFHDTDNTKSFRETLNQNINFAGILLASAGLGGSLAMLYSVFSDETGLRKAECQDLADNESLEDEEFSSNSLAKQDKLRFNWSEFFRFVTPDIFYIICAVIAALCAAYANVQIGFLLGDVVEVVSANSSSNDFFLAQVKIPALRLGVTCVAQSMLTCAYITIMHFVGERLACRIRCQLFSSLIQQDISFYDNHRTGDLMARLLEDVQEYKHCFKLGVTQGLRTATQSIGCLVSMFLIAPELTIAIFSLLLAVTTCGMAIGNSLRALSLKVHSQSSEASIMAEENIVNIRTVRAFAMEDLAMSTYKGKLDTSLYDNYKLGLGIGVFQSLSNLVINGLLLGILCTGGHLVSTNHMQAGDLMSCLVSMQTIQRSIGQLFVMFGQVIRGNTAGARVFQFTVMHPMVTLHGGKTIDYHSLLGDVHFKNVTFTYPTRPGQVILNKLNLKVPAGSVVALCGQSGAGKSTIVALLERFYEPDFGSILLDNIPLNELDPSWLRQRVIGLIAQEPVLFATTIRENIRYGKPSASDHEVEQAAKQAYCHDFISTFPRGYDTVVGERGVTVSGGQKQRIAIARALIKDPCIIILDEATSALDAESEQMVQKALNDVMKNRTTIIIAHRLSTIQNADMIAVVKDGHVKETGTHKELLKKSGLYSELLRKQVMK